MHEPKSVYCPRCDIWHTPGGCSGRASAQPHAPAAPTRADVPRAAAASFDALSRAAAQGALLMVPLVTPKGAIVYSVGAIVQDEAGGYWPLAYILAPDQADGMRQATRADLEAAGHISPEPPAAPRIILPD